MKLFMVMKFLLLLWMVALGVSTECKIRLNLWHWKSAAVSADCVDKVHEVV